MRVINMQNRIELCGQRGVKIVAQPLGLRKIDHPDRPLQAPFTERGEDLRVIPRHQEVEKISVSTGNSVKQCFVASVFSLASILFF
jgi:hypothetical protein